MFQILIAPNSFKNSLKADQVAEVIEKGLKASGLKASLSKFPIADGGDYSSFLICQHLHGEMNAMEVQGAYLTQTKASYGLINSGKTAVIEVAETSGFKSIQNKLKNPLDSTSKGLGQLIQSQIKSGITDFMICLGGSATVDAGIGLLQELGLKFLDKKGKEFIAFPRNFDQVVSMDLSILNKTLLNCHFTILCDVENKLLGDQGAAKVFGPQKGANPADVNQLESFLEKFDELAKNATQKSLNEIKGGGAAGGLGAAFAVFMNAELKQGASYFCEITHFDAALSKSNLLITGEGSIDEQSLNGKAPITVAAKAQKLKIPCIALAGKIPVEVPQNLQDYFTMLLPIGNQPQSLEESMEKTYENLYRTSIQIGKMLMMTK